MQLQNNKITPRQIVVLIGGFVLIYSGIDILDMATYLLVTLDFEIHPEPDMMIKGLIETILLGLAFIISGILLLIKSRLLRIILKLITKKRENKQ